MYKALDIWILPYLRQALKRPWPPQGPGPLTICLAVADHFEPYWAGAGEDTASARLDVWEAGLPRLVEGLEDSRGRPPQHDFFYPLEDYRPQVLDRLAALREQGLGEVEVHLHHHGESTAELEDMLAGYAQKLHQRHGLLAKDPDSGAVTYGFIHGNWSLDNSRPDGQWCGRNDELGILARTGCYADFTLPSAPSPTQTRTINSIYYATDDPDRPKSHDRGRPARVGLAPSGDLLLVQGVLALNWQRRKMGFLPRLETSDMGAHLPPRPERIPLWLRFAPAVKGAEQIRFLKLSCHGAQEKHHDSLLGGPARRTLEELCTRYNDGQRYRLLFVTCREMVQAIHALERGEDLPW